MTFEPQTQAAIARIVGVIHAAEVADIDQDAWEDCASWIETADDHQIESAICLCGSIKAGEAEITSLWRLAFGDYAVTPQYALSFSLAMFELVAIGANQAVKEAT